MGKTKKNNNASFLFSVSPYDVAEIHRLANSSYVAHNANNLSFDPDKSTLLKSRASNSHARKEVNNHKSNGKTE